MEGYVAGFLWSGNKRRRTNAGMEKYCMEFPQQRSCIRVWLLWCTGTNQWIEFSPSISFICKLWVQA